jgi:hypothetical protein
MAQRHAGPRKRPPRLNRNGAADGLRIKRDALLTSRVKRDASSPLPASPRLRNLFVVGLDLGDYHAHADSRPLRKTRKIFLGTIL